MKKFTRDLQHYSTLYFILFFGVLAYLIYAYDRIIQMAVVFALAAAYTAWGIVHHKIHGDLRWSIFIEYLGVSALGIIIVLSLLINA